MSTEGILLAIVLTGLSLAWVVAPLVRERSARSRSHDAYAKRRERLLVYYERVITNIRDLDEDYTTGKLAQDEYATEREDWVQRGIQVLKALDALEADAPPDEPLLTDEAAIDREIDSVIEAAVAARRAQRARQT
jgi:hypothetical protein